MIITSSRLTLRAAASSDDEFIANIMNDPFAYSGWGPHFPIAAADVNSVVKGPDSKVLIASETSTGQAVGFIQFRLEWGDSIMAIEYVFFAQQFQGTGYGTEATAALAEFFFNKFGGRRIELHLRSDNARAQHSYEKIGFQIEGRRREVAPPQWDPGTSRDYLIMGLLKEEFISPH